MIVMWVISPPQNFESRKIVIRYTTPAFLGECFRFVFALSKEYQIREKRFEFGRNYDVIEEKSIRRLPLMDKRRMLFQACLSRDIKFKSRLLGAHKKI